MKTEPSPNVPSAAEVSELAQSINAVLKGKEVATAVYALGIMLFVGLDTYFHGKIPKKGVWSQFARMLRRFLGPMLADVFAQPDPTRSNTDQIKETTAPALKTWIN